VPAGADGRVRCRTNLFVKAFLAEHPEQTDRLEKIWWYSGDIGHLTENGILCILGRADEVINAGGVKMSGPALDEAVRTIPGIRDAGVCGVRGQSGMEELWIGIVPEKQIAIAEIRTMLSHLPEFRGSALELFVVNKIPRNDLGKLIRHQLRDMLISIKDRPSSDT